MKKNSINRIRIPKDTNGNALRRGDLYFNTVQVRATNLEVEMRHLLVNSDGLVRGAGHGGPSVQKSWYLLLWQSSPETLSRVTQRGTP